MKIDWFQILLALFGIYLLLFLNDYLYVYTPLIGLALTAPFITYFCGVKTAIAYCVLHSFAYIALLAYYATGVFYLALSYARPFVSKALNITQRVYLLAKRIQ